MKLIDKFIFKNKNKTKFKPKCIMSIGVNTNSASGSGGFVGSGGSISAFLPKDKSNPLNPSLISKFSEIEEIYLKNNKDAKNLIININGIIAVEDGIVNEQYEAIRVTYSPLTIDLNIIIKIYSFTSGEKIIFSKNSQKNKLIDALNSNNISIDIIDLIKFE